MIGLFQLFQEGVGISRNWAAAHCLASDGWLQNCVGTCGCVIQMVMHYNERMLKLRVHWKLCFPSSWAVLFGSHPMAMPFFKGVPYQLPSWISGRRDTASPQPTTSGAMGFRPGSDQCSHPHQGSIQRGRWRGAGLLRSPQTACVRDGLVVPRIPPRKARESGAS